MLRSLSRMQQAVVTTATSTAPRTVAAQSGQQQQQQRSPNSRRWPRQSEDPSRAGSTAAGGSGSGSGRKNWRRSGEEGRRQQRNSNRWNHRPRERPNAFIAFRITQPSLREQISEIHSSISAVFPSVSPALVSPDISHVTLLTLKLNKREIDPENETETQAIRTLASVLCDETILRIIPRSLDFSCLSSFPGNNVIFMKPPEEDENTDRLKDFIMILRKRFHDDGLLCMGGNEVDDVKIHLSVFRGVFCAELLRAENAARRPGASTVQDEIWRRLQEEGFTDRHFGSQPIGELELLWMGDKGPDNYYSRIVTLKIPAPPADPPPATPPMSPRRRPGTGETPPIVRGVGAESLRDGKAASTAEDLPPWEPLGQRARPTRRSEHQSTPRVEEEKADAPPPRSSREEVQCAAAGAADADSHEKDGELWHFAYGLFTSQKELHGAGRRITTFYRIAGRLEGFSVIFNHRGGLPNLQPHSQSAVHGILQRLKRCDVDKLLAKAKGYEVRELEVQDTAESLRYPAVVLVSREGQAIAGSDAWDQNFSVGLDTSPLPPPSTAVSNLRNGAKESALPFPGTFFQWLDSLPVVDPRVRDSRYFVTVEADINKGHEKEGDSQLPKRSAKSRDTSISASQYYGNKLADTTSSSSLLSSASASTEAKQPKSPRSRRLQYSWLQ